MAVVDVADALAVTAPLLEPDRLDRAGNAVVAFMAVAELCSKGNEWIPVAWVEAALFTEPDNPMDVAEYSPVSPISLIFTLVAEGPAEPEAWEWWLETLVARGLLTEPDRLAVRWAPVAVKPESVALTEPAESWAVAVCLMDSDGLKVVL